MLKKGFRYVFMAEENGGAGSGAGGSGGAAAAAAEGVGEGAAEASAAAGAGEAAAGAAAAGEGSSITALAAGAQPAQIPEKYQVKKEDGSLDIEASSLKLAEAYGHLEKRLGSGDVPPKTADDYQITVPDALKDAIDTANDPLLKDFKKEALAAGLNQKQMDFVMAKYFDIAPDLVNGSRQLTAEDCVSDLRSEWKSEDQYKSGVGNAYKAALGYFGDDADAMIKEYGNDPRFIRGLARMGSEMGEDRSLSHQGSSGGESVESLMSSEAYSNPKHADHARVSGQVQKHFEGLAAAAEKSGAAPIL